MKKQHHKFPRPAKALLRLALLAFLVFLVYVILGCPPLTARMAFRRAERANMTGPGKILAQFPHTEYDGLDIIIAETDHSYLLFLDNSRSLNYDRFYNPTKGGESVYFTFRTYPKKDSVSLYAIPNSYRPTNLILFHEEADAVRAEMELELEYVYDGGTHRMPVKAEAHRKYDGFFVFSIAADQPTEQWYRAMSVLQAHCSQYGSGKPTVTIRLYDKHDNLLRTETILPGPSL